MQLDLFGDKLLQQENEHLKCAIESIIWYCYHLKDTKANYNQIEIANYILSCIIDNKKED